MSRSRLGSNLRATGSGSATIRCVPPDGIEPPSAFCKNAAFPLDERGMVQRRHRANDIGGSQAAMPALRGPGRTRTCNFLFLWHKPSRSFSARSRADDVAWLRHELNVYLLGFKQICKPSTPRSLGPCRITVGRGSVQGSESPRDGLVFGRSERPGDPFSITFSARAPCSPRGVCVLASEPRRGLEPLTIRLQGGRSTR